MGKRKTSGKTAAAGYSPFTPGTLREESSGKKQKPVNAKSMLKLDHLQKLAVWTSREASIPSLGAFFGNRLSVTAEALSVPADPNLFSCQRCGSILQPGYNCTVRIENKNTKKSSRATQNNVVYNCHFCSHQNLKRGTPKNYMKEMCMPKVKSGSKVNMVTKNVREPEVLLERKDNAEIINAVSSQELAIDEHVVNSPSTPITRQANTLLDLRTKKRSRSGLRKTVQSASSSAPTDGEKSSNTSIKRKRKSWTSLKEIAERSAQDDTRSFGNLKIPFLMI